MPTDERVERAAKAMLNGPLQINGDIHHDVAEDGSYREEYWVNPYSLALDLARAAIATLHFPLMQAENAGEVGKVYTSYYERGYEAGIAAPRSVRRNDMDAREDIRDVVRTTTAAGVEWAKYGGPYPNFDDATGRIVEMVGKLLLSEEAIEAVFNALAEYGDENGRFLAWCKKSDIPSDPICDMKHVEWEDIRRQWPLRILRAISTTAFGKEG